MKATHTDYLHPRHLRIEENGEVFCMSPSCSDYGRLAKASLPKFSGDLPRDQMIGGMREVVGNGQ